MTEPETYTVTCTEHGPMERNEIPSQLQGTSSVTWQCRADGCRTWLSDEDAHAYAQQLGLREIRVWMSGE